MSSGKPEPKKYDIVVIGSGPGGEGAAMTATKSGKRVAIVDKFPLIGGACTHLATIPSKALRHIVSMRVEYNRSNIFRKAGDPIVLSFPEILSASKGVIEKQVKLRTDFYVRNHVDIYQGVGQFIDKNTLNIVRDGKIFEQLKADHIIIATGSRPYRPDYIDFEHPCVFDSDTLLKMDDTPSSIIIFGAGVIGCEYASIMRGLGVQVDLINNRDKLLSFMDDEITDALSYHLRDQDVLVRHNEEFAKIEYHDDSITVYLESGKKVHASALLWAMGRTGNTDQLNLKKIGIIANERGQLDVNEGYCTTQENIYAVGDVIGWPSLASAAYDQGRFAATEIVDGCCDVKLTRDIPTGIYTIPEISSVGRTEKELTDEQVPYEVGHAFFKDLARAQIEGQQTGMLKLLFHRETLEILGIHCFGEDATEIIHIGQAIMRQPKKYNTIRYFTNTTFNYPTMAEAYRVAALNGLNRIC